jgi:hypothetical protein
MTDDILFYGVVFVLVLGAFFIAKWSDIYWQIKQKRKYLKKDFHLACIVSKDMKNITPKIFNPEQSTIWHDGKVYTVEKRRIYRKDKPEDGFMVPKPKFEEGIPVIYIDDESFRPLDFDFTTPTVAKPGEAGAILKSWEVNAAAKAMVSAYDKMKQQAMFVMIILGLCVLIAGLVYFTYTAADNSNKQLANQQVQITEIHDYLMPPPPNYTNSTTPSAGAKK